MQDSRCFRLKELEPLEPDQLLAVWEDGHESLYPYRLLRESCECAACLHEWTRERLLDPGKIPEGIRVGSWEWTGHYGVNLHFSDGHRSGIYTLRRLRSLCPCVECSEGSQGKRE